ncbi:hypothetical protein [Bacillus massiliigorillae]|uniref:hypothetical protein n=1 Tax=Bacillus massiliigorillae TaxID=1243664 RepID=UPI0003AA888F|nr:hypothetical protein [Bacillus massiliigorillae]
MLFKSSNKRRLFINNQRIEVEIDQTAVGDFIARANFAGKYELAVGRNQDQEVAKEICIKKLFDTVKNSDSSKNKKQYC